MPKAQRKPRSSSTRATPLAARNANASKQPPGLDKTSKSKKVVESEKGPANSPQLSKATATSHEVSSADSDSACNYLILATLSGSTNPSITRLLSLPPSLTFDKLHGVLQISFGWTDSHMHDFNVSLVDGEVGFMGPCPCLSIYPDPSHLPDDLRADSKAESEVTLADIYEKPEWKNKAQIDYEYDHGDGWNHHLALLGRATPGANAQFGAPNDVKILCLDGQGHPAAEDVGGTCGWRGLKEAFKHPRKAENREQVGWYKNGCLNGDKNLDSYAFDVLDVNDGLRDAFRDAFPKSQSRGDSDDACAGCKKDL